MGRAGGGSGRGLLKLIRLDRSQENNGNLGDISGSQGEE
jgi:hypothetical protein